MVQCPYCFDKIDRRDQEAEKSILRIHIENKHPERVVG